MRKLSVLFALCLLPVAAHARQGAATRPASSGLPSGLSASAGLTVRPRFEFFGAPSARRLWGGRRTGGPTTGGAGNIFLSPPLAAVTRFLPLIVPQGSSGTVNSGTAGRFAFYASTGTAVSENTRLSEGTGNTLTYSGAGGLDLTGSTDSGQIQLSGATSGTVTLSVQDAAGTYTFKLPDSGGSSGQVLTTDGTGATSWTTTATGGTPPFDTLTSGSTVTWSFSGSERRKANLTLSTNAALAFSGVSSGSEGDLYVKQDGTGSRTLTLPANSYVAGNGAGVITLSSAANAIDKLHFAYDGTRYYWDAPASSYTTLVGVTVGNVSHAEGVGVGLTHNNNGNYLLLGISQGYPADNSSIETAVSYGGSSMTKIADTGPTNYGKRMTVWALLSPPTGSNSFTITEPTGGYKVWVLSAISLSGVNTTTPTGTVATATGTSGTATVNSSSASNEVVVGFVSAGTASPSDVTDITVGSGQTQRTKASSGSTYSIYNFGGSSTQPGSSTTTTSWTVTYTSGGTHDWNIVAVPVKP
ncbi:MAG: hypothetical protein JOZ96_29935 [Acidobacteria bacterium]|nr:hypothetical protein [Acidobacteriota bacterium]